MYDNGIKDLTKLAEFDDHEFVGFIGDKKIGLTGFIAIHRKLYDKPSFGATRLWSYASVDDSLKDVLRLSKIMSYKSALAGLKYGGAKGVINFNRGLKKESIVKGYAKFVNKLRGSFITGADVGIERTDLENIGKITPYLVGLKVDPAECTALGLFYSIKECLQELYGKENIEGKSFAIKGLGKVGRNLLRLLYSSSGRIFIADIDKNIIRELEKEFPRVKTVSPSEIHQQKVDVFSPCALGRCLTRKSVKKLNCQVVIGGANNQLENDSIGNLLFKSGILYIPDFVVNAGGLISVIYEYENKKIIPVKLRKRIRNIKNTVRLILDKSLKQKSPTNLVANELAENIIKNGKLFNPN